MSKKRKRAAPSAQDPYYRRFDDDWDDCPRLPRLNRRRRQSKESSLMEDFETAGEYYNGNNDQRDRR